MELDRLLRVFLFTSLIVCLWISQAEANTYTVTTTTDSGAGSLRKAITDANAHAGPDTIAFNVPFSDAGFSAVSGVWTIRPASALPNLTDGGTVIDGTTQGVHLGDRNPLGPEIEIDGTNAANANGFNIKSPDNIITGLIINRVTYTAIEVNGALARGNIIVGNYIGTDPTGMVAQGNHFGGIWIRFGANNTRIGGPTASDRNLISGTTTSVNLATGNGVYVDEADSNWIVGNYIGVNREGTAKLPNINAGVCMRECKFNIVGGTDPGSANIISGNGWLGIVLRIPTGRNNTICGNYIGTDTTGRINLGNGSYGIRFDFGAQKNTIGPGNIVAFNGSHGIIMSHDSTLCNTITRNAISRNGDSGIANEDGGNGMISPPTLTAASASFVRGIALPNSTVELFSDSLEEGEIYEGTVTADAIGIFTWSGTVSGPHVTATCTDADGNTSAFSTYAPLTGINEDLHLEAPVEYTLSQNYPNPFNPKTVVSWLLPVISNVRLVVYDVLGREVAVLVNERQDAGVHEVRFDGSGLSSGMYFYRLQAGTYVQTRKLLLVR